MVLRQIALVCWYHFDYFSELVIGLVGASLSSWSCFLAFDVYSHFLIFALGSLQLGSVLSLLVGVLGTLAIFLHSQFIIRSYILHRSCSSQRPCALYVVTIGSRLLRDLFQIPVGSVPILLIQLPPDLLHATQQLRRRALL